MVLKQITLNHFRNFKKSTFEISPYLTVVIGENARGKTNLLEGVYFLTQGVGFRESKEEELITSGNADVGSVEAIVIIEEKPMTFVIMLIKKGEFVTKSFLVSKAKKRQADYLKQQLKTVLFAPEQVEMITGAPSRRRDYMNRFISSYDLEYKARLSNFEGALRKRNKLLESHPPLDILHKQIEFWNKYLEEQAGYLTKARAEYISFSNDHPTIDLKEFSMMYLKSELTEEKLREKFELEARVGRTLIGPQKDDFEITISGKNVHHFGSRSEQRLAILWLKMNEIYRYEEKFTMKPLLLLDDVFSEFDTKNKKIVIDLVKKYQTIATTTEPEILELAEVPKTVIKL